MNMDNYKKIENEAGYPVYIDNCTGKQQYDHPEFIKIMQSIEEYDGIKYSTYRTAFKICALQRHLKVPPLRISSGVFVRHQLSLSESSLSLDTAELEAVLGDIYFAAEKEGLFTGDVDLVVDLLINLLLNVYDKERKEPVRVLAAKTLLICLSEEAVSAKWAALANCSADHNGCVSARRLAALLAHVAALASHLGGGEGAVQHDVDACFANNAGMLGMSSRAVAAWGAEHCRSTQWLGAVQRAARSRGEGACAACSAHLTQVLTFQCTKCEVYFCEKCYLYDKNLNVRGHKKTHPVQEVIDGQLRPPVCLSFIKGMKRFFSCKSKKPRVPKASKQRAERESGRRRREGRPGMVTSTVGKAAGHKDHPATLLQDIINQLEAHYKVLAELARDADLASKSASEGLRSKVEAHWEHVSAQINRLKLLKDNLSSSEINLSSPAAAKSEHPQAFDLFSPIPVVEEKQCKMTDTKTQPRVLSLDSGNFSVVSKTGSQHVLSVSGEGMKAGTVTSDTISAVSVNDISSWYNETGHSTDKRCPTANSKPADVSASEQRHAADNLRVERRTRHMGELSAGLDAVLDRLQHMLAHNFTVDESCVDNTQLRETASEMEGLLGTLIRGVELRASQQASRAL